VRLTAATLILACFTLTAEEAVLWEYDFHTLPPGWQADQWWDFTDSGAEIYVSYGGTSGWLGGDFGSFDTTAFIPDGTDSLIITAEQLLSLSGNNSYSFADVSISLNHGSSWQSVFYQTSNYSTTDPLVIALAEEIQGGDSIQVRFQAVAIGTMYGGSTAYWRLEDFVMTAYGEGLLLQQCSWGRIKASWSSTPSL